MKNKKKITVITLSILLVSILSTVTYNLSLNKEVIASNHMNKNNDRGMLSLLVETGLSTGKYTESTSSTWPDGYSLNKSLSKCENGGTLEFDEENKKVSVSTKSSDRCYVYFDYPLPDVTINPTNVPTTYGSLANLSCSGAISTYNEKYQRIEISQLSTKNVGCNLSYTNRTNKTYLNDYIMGLSGTTQGTGQVVNENGYRYEGQDPNNYIWFNNEMWRIIGVFDSTSHGVANTNLVKIIRNETIGGLTWDKSNKTNWSTASLKALLNNEYLNSTNGTDGDNCYGYKTILKAKCDYRASGIKDAYRGMVREVTWYLGGHSDSSVTTSAMYGYERDATSKYADNPASINAQVGLMYASDYGYAVPAANCSRTTNNVSYSNANCSLNNWLYGNGWEWTITPRSNAGGAFHLNCYNEVGSFYTSNGYVVRPVLYLDSSVYRISGSGSESDPYIIGM